MEFEQSVVDVDGLERYGLLIEEQGRWVGSEGELTRWNGLKERECERGR